MKDIEEGISVRARAEALFSGWGTHFEEVGKQASNLEESLAKDLLRGEKVFLGEHQIVLLLDPPDPKKDSTTWMSWVKKIIGF